MIQYAAGMRPHTSDPLFAKADELALQVYRATESMSDDGERGLRTEIRAHMRHVVCALVDANLPHRQRTDRAAITDMAIGEATLTRYLLSLANRLDYVKDVDAVLGSCDALIRELSEQIR